jgi:SAM-dependent methyltransferase
MTWDPIWEEIFRQRDWGKYPPEELIRFMARCYYTVPDRKQVKVLEIGCGMGANVWYLAREGFDAHGIDGSPTVIEKARRRMQQEGVSATFHVGDVNTLLDFYHGQRFDLIIDVGCLVCNKLREVHNIVAQALELLKPGGRLFSMVVARGSYGDGSGREIEPGTFMDATEGVLAGRGLMHLFTLEEVEELFRGLTDVRIEYSEYSVENRKHRVKHWVAEGARPQ